MYVVIFQNKEHSGCSIEPLIESIAELASILTINFQFRYIFERLLRSQYIEFLVLNYGSQYQSSEIRKDSNSLHLVSLVESG